MVLVFHTCASDCNSLYSLVLMLYAIVMLLCKVGCDNRRRKTSGVSNLKEYPRLVLPYPKPSPKDSSCKWPRHNSHRVKQIYFSFPTATSFVDPFLVTNNFDNSLISNDGSFKRVAIPEPVLRRDQFNPSALNLPEQMMDARRPQPQLNRPNDKESICTYLIYTFKLPSKQKLQFYHQDLHHLPIFVVPAGKLRDRKYHHINLSLSFLLLFFALHIICFL